MMKGRPDYKLCAIDDTGRAKALAETPIVSCGLCGAQSHDPANVCEPVKITATKTGARAK